MYSESGRNQIKSFIEMFFNKNENLFNEQQKEYIKKLIEKVGKTLYVIGYKECMHDWFDDINNNKNKNE